MLAVGGAGHLGRAWAEIWRAGAEVWGAGADAWPRQERQIIPPIQPKHPHPTPPHRDGTVDDVRHGDDPPVGDAEPGGDPMARGNAQRSQRRRGRGARSVGAEERGDGECCRDRARECEDR